jgi:hypothetical protein
MTTTGPSSVFSSEPLPSSRCFRFFFDGGCTSDSLAAKKACVSALSNTAAYSDQEEEAAACAVTKAQSVEWTSVAVHSPPNPAGTVPAGIANLLMTAQRE